MQNIILHSHRPWQSLMFHVAMKSLNEIVFLKVPIYNFCVNVKNEWKWSYCTFNQGSIKRS